MTKNKRYKEGIFETVFPKPIHLKKDDRIEMQVKISPKTDFIRVTKVRKNKGKWVPTKTVFKRKGRSAKK